MRRILIYLVAPLIAHFVVIASSVEFCSALETFDVIISDGEDHASLTFSGSKQVLVQGGHVSHLHFRQMASGEITGGDQSHVEVHDVANVVVTGGEIGHFRAYESASVKVQGGNFDFLTAYDSSEIIVDGMSTSISVLLARDGGVINLYSGNVRRINSFSGGVTNIFGGVLSGSLALNSDTVTNAYGFDFNLELSGSFLGMPIYQWTGTLSDGTPVDTVVFLPIDAELNFVIVPEPTDLAILTSAVIVSLCFLDRRVPLLACSAVRTR